MPARLSDDTLLGLLEMEAESQELDPKEVGITDELEAAVDQYEEALERALEELVERFPPADGATIEDLEDAKAAYLVLMTLRGEGVGIWDGEWDEFYRPAQLNRGGDVREFLEKKLHKFADVTGGGSLNVALSNAAWETAGDEEEDAGEEDSSDTDVPDEEYLGNRRLAQNAETDRIPTAAEWFKRFPDLGRDPLFTIRLKLPCGTVTVRAWEGPPFSAVGQYNTHTRLYCELSGCGVKFPREDYYVGLPRGTTLDGKDAKESVMALFAMKPGDTDDEFFEEYTPAQLEFVEQYGEEIYMIKLDRYGEG